MDMKDIEEGRRRWQERYDASRRRDADFTTLYGAEVETESPPAAIAGRSATTRPARPTATTPRCPARR